MTSNAELLKLSYIPVIYHTMERANTNPYMDADYFAEHKFMQGMKRLSKRFKRVWENQKGKCHHCGLSMDFGEDKEIFFKSPKSSKDEWAVTDMAYVHSYCQKLYLERCS